MFPKGQKLDEDGSMDFISKEDDEESKQAVNHETSEPPRLPSPEIVNMHATQNVFAHLGTNSKKKRSKRHRKGKANQEEPEMPSISDILIDRSDG